MGKTAVFPSGPMLNLQNVSLWIGQIHKRQMANAVDEPFNNFTQKISALLQHLFNSRMNIIHVKCQVTNSQPVGD